jgi:hypothetical protein
VACTEFPVIVMTSNGERDFPGPFLRRCIRFTMPAPSAGMLSRVVGAHLSAPGDNTAALVQLFADRIESGDNLAVDQLLNAVYLLGHDAQPTDEARVRLRELLLRELSRA